MKDTIHPKYMDATIRCSCGQEFQTRSTKPAMHLDVCSVCHPFYSGESRIIDTAGRVERFHQKYGTKKADA